MNHLNIEIKARAADPDFIKSILKKEGAIFQGLDKQTDTYFNVPFGRLKVREGNIENSLIHYKRSNQDGPRQSEFMLLPVMDPYPLKAVLAASLGIKVVVEKSREIYFIENVKFHLDSIVRLGSFVEIEAGNMLKIVSPEILHQQCQHYLEAFGIKQEDMVPFSYSDMILQLTTEE